MSTAAQIAKGVQMEVHIEASPAKVWQALTEGIGEWWPSEFFIGGEEGKRSYHLEAEPGGRMYEKWDDGGGLLWGQVVTVIPEKMLQVTSQTFPAWGGPAMLYAAWTLSETEGGCKLDFQEDVLGNVPDSHAASKEKGWTYLLEGVLKAHLEGKPKPSWED